MIPKAMAEEMELINETVVSKEPETKI